MIQLLRSIERVLVHCSSRLYERFGPARRLIVVDGDSLPAQLPKRDLVLAREGTEEWSVGMLCPCGCSRVVELLLVKEANPRWSLSVDAKGRPSLSPSVWLKQGCRSHFFVRSGRVVWGRS